MNSINTGSPKRNQAGFSVIKFLFWIVALGFIVTTGFKLLGIHQTNWKIQEVFDSVSTNMAEASENAIRKKLPTLFKINYIARGDIPQEFYDNLVIKSVAGQVEISSSYSDTLWPLGRVENLDADGMYYPEDLTGMDVWRDKTRQDFIFEPYAKTP